MAKNSAKRRSAQEILSQTLAAFAPETDLVAYEHHTKEFFDDCQPATPTEVDLVKVIANTSWWLRRILAIETNILNAAIAERQESVSPDQPQISSGLAMAMAFSDQSRVLEKLSQHEERLSNLFYRSVKRLHKIQADRRACGPPQDGFVLSGGENETRAHRNDRLKQAWNAPYHRA